MDDILPEAFLQRIRGHRVTLRECISKPRLDEMLIRLEAMDVRPLTMLESQTIKSKPTDIERADEFIRLTLLQGTLTSVQQVVEVMEEVNLGHLAVVIRDALLETLGACPTSGPKVRQSEDIDTAPPQVAMAAAPIPIFPADPIVREVDLVPYIPREGSGVRVSTVPPQEYRDRFTFSRNQNNQTTCKTIHDDLEVYPGFYDNRCQGKALVVAVHQQEMGEDGSRMQSLGSYTGDRDRMCEVLTQIGMETVTPAPQGPDRETRPCLTAREIEVAMYNFKETLSDDDPCCMVTLMTHGKDRSVYGSDGKLVDVEKILRTFDDRHCPKMAGKPKIFIIQACQGSEEDHGMPRAVPSSDDVTRQPQSYVNVPFGCDMLVMYASVRGYKSWVTDDGSVLIKELCRQLEQNACKLEFHHLLLNVNRHVGQAIVRDDNNKTQKQQCHFDSHLTKQLYFFPRPRSNEGQ